MVEVDANTAAEKAKAVKAGELPAPAKSLAEAMCRVMEQVSYLQKDKEMRGGGSYKYISVEAVISALRPEMVKQGIVLVPADMQLVVAEVINGKMNRVMLRVTFTLKHAATGEEMPVCTVGEAMDIGDKASNKAMTAARKAALIIAFNIETGNDPDDVPSYEQQRVSQPRQQPAPQPQKAQPQSDGPPLSESVSRLSAGYAACKTAADFEQLEGQRRDLWSRLVEDTKTDLRAAALKTRQRLGLAPVAN